MNMQAAFKTLLVVLGIGAITGFNEWRTVYGGTPEDRAKREVAQCMREGEAAAYRANPIAMGHTITESNQRIKAECLAKVDGGVPRLGVDLAPPPKTKLYAPLPAASSKEHFTASGQRMTQSREQCLGRIEDARKRSPGGLNPDWENGERKRCDALYLDSPQ